MFGVKALHSKKVLHRDLKSANVFLTSNKTLKIGDFGISKVLDNTSAKTFVGTPYYLSPEVCENRPYNLSSDLWSLGCIIYEMCTMTVKINFINIVSFPSIKPFGPGNENPYRLSKAITLTIFALIKQHRYVFFSYKKGNYS